MHSTDHFYIFWYVHRDYSFSRARFGLVFILLEKGNK